jgi:hypothetical protein
MDDTKVTTQDDLTPGQRARQALVAKLLVDLVPHRRYEAAWPWPFRRWMLAVGPDGYLWARVPRDLRTDLLAELRASADILTGRKGR